MKLKCLKVKKIIVRKRDQIPIKSEPVKIDPKAKLRRDAGIKTLSEKARYLETHKKAYVEQMKNLKNLKI